MRERCFRFFLQPEMAAQFRIGAAVLHKHAGDEHAFGDRPFARSGHLEALAGVFGEAVEIEAVIPVGTADQRQPVRTQMLHRVVEAAAEMLHERLRKREVAVKRHGFLQNGVVPRLTDVGVGSGNQPKRIVVEAAADRHVAFFGQRLILMVGAAVRELRGGDVQDSLSRSLRDHMHKTEQILAGIPEAHASSHAAFKIAGAAAHVKGHHALVLIPDIDHTADMFVFAGKREVGEQNIPKVPQLLFCREKLFIAVIALLQGDGALLVDDAGAFPFFFLRILDIAEHQDDALRLPGLKLHGELHGADRRPAVGNAVGAAVTENRLRLCRAAVYTDKGVPRGIERIRGAVRPQEGVVIAAFAVFRFMIDRVSGDFHFSRRIIPLEVGGVVHRIPEAEFGVGENINLLFFFPYIGNRYPAEQAGVAPRHQHLLRSQNAVFFALKNCIAQPVAADVGIQLRLDRLPGNIPDFFICFQINMKAILIQGAGIIAVAGDAA